MFENYNFRHLSQPLTSEPLRFFSKYICHQCVGKIYSIKKYDVQMNSANMKYANIFYGYTETTDNMS